MYGTSTDTSTTHYWRYYYLQSTWLVLVPTENQNKAVVQWYTGTVLVLVLGSPTALVSGSIHQLLQ
jgi:hypothetical protein